MTTINFSCDDTFTVVLAKKTRFLPVTLGDLPDHICRDLMFYGLQQKLADAGADPEKYGSPDAKENVAREVLNNLYAGEWGKRRESAPGMGREETLARKLCTTNVAKKLGIKGKPNDEQIARITALVDVHWEKFVETAKKQLAEKDAAASIEISI
jgi:hypothetical protein